MAFFNGASRRREHSQHSQFDTFGASQAGSNDWAEPEQPDYDWKKVVLVIGLGALSWVATYVGMLELIQANMGDLPLTHKVIIGFSVAMLMIMIIWILDQLFSPINFSTKLIYCAGYIFLSVISVGFGFGFYWKVLESRSEATRSAESAISQVQNALHAGSTRLEQLNSTLVQLTQVSTQKAVEEREKGTSCPNSRPGDGPRRKLRDADAQRFAFSSEFVGSRVSSVKADMAALDGELKKLSDNDKSTIDAKSGTRNEFMRALNRKLDMTVTGFNAFRTDPQLRQIRADLAARAEQTVFPTSSGGKFSCPDSQLQAALRGVVRAIDQLPEMGKPEVAAVEGSEATIEAFRRLTASIEGILTLSPPPSSDELRALQKKAVQSVAEANGRTESAYARPAGLSKRDYVPLAIAIFVDLCLLLVSMGRPMNRLNNLVPKMREAEKGPIISILSRFNEIHRDPQIRQNFEVFRHVVFDLHGDYYVAVPLDTPYNRVDPRTGAMTSYGTEEAQDLQHEAHLLANLFTSFEREKIFRRVHNPLLSSQLIRKRLARQGSKFAGSEAFRLYKFRDGAWSEIILSAVMGAAKRVEDQKRREQLFEDQWRAKTGPTLGEAGTSDNAPPYVMADVKQKTDRGWSGLDLGGLSSAAGRAFTHGRGTNGHNGNGEARSEVAQTNDTAAKQGEARTGWFANFSLDDDALDDDLDKSDLDHVDEEQLRSQYGPYAKSVRKDLTRRARQRPTQTDVFTSETPANSNGPDGKDKSETKDATNGYRADETGDVIVLNGTAKIKNENNASGLNEDGFAEVEIVKQDVGLDDSETTVTLTRETATITVPVSEAALPKSLLETSQNAPAEDLNKDPVAALAPPLSHPAAGHEDVEVIAASPHVTANGTATPLENGAKGIQSIVERLRSHLN